MAVVNLKLVELRKRNQLTQQELGEALGVSHQNISKWENGVTMPDITLLPALSEYFQVSVDELLGLVPLSTEYRPAQTGCRDYWADKTDYLMQKRVTLWNMDYIQFLIEKVWKISKPVNVLDCGCGYGYLGLLLLPLLPEGSTYTGIDFTRELLDAGAAAFERSGLKGRFICDDILNVKFSEKYDLVISQTILRHVDRSTLLLRKMIGFAKKGGLVVSIEGNREFEENGLYIDGMDYAELCRHEGLESFWRKELQMQGRDYAVAMKVPHYMKKYGLKNIGVRVNDRVTYLEPEQEQYESIFSTVMKTENWEKARTEEEREGLIHYFMNHGMTRKEAEDYLRKQDKISEFIKDNNGKISMTRCGGLMISYGWAG